MVLWGFYSCLYGSFGDETSLFSGSCVLQVSELVAVRGNVKHFLVLLKHKYLDGFLQNPGFSYRMRLKAIIYPYQTQPRVLLL